MPPPQAGPLDRPPEGNTPRPLSQEGVEENRGEAPMPPPLGDRDIRPKARERQKGREREVKQQLPREGSAAKVTKMGPGEKSDGSVLRMEDKLGLKSLKASLESRERLVSRKRLSSPRRDEGPTRPSQPHSENLPLPWTARPRTRTGTQSPLPGPASQDGCQ